MKPAEVIEWIWNEELTSRERVALATIAGVDLEDEAQCALNGNFNPLVAEPIRSLANAVNLVQWKELSGEARQKLTVGLHRMRQLSEYYVRLIG